MKKIFYLILLVLVLVTGYFIGSEVTRKKYENTVLNNYGYVREIAELATIEVSGMTNMKSSNVAGDESWGGALKKAFFEKSVKISVPYTAKFGLDLKDSSLRIEKKDSVVAIYLPKPKLLSYELKLDRQETNIQKGWFTAADEDAYTKLQQKLYLESRKQLENNTVYLQETKEKACTLLQIYFKAAGLNAACYFDGEKENQVHVEMK